MGNIHLLGSIINDLENELIKYAKRSDAKEYILKSRQELINKLTSIYENYSHMTMWEIFEIMQKDIDKMFEKDNSITHVVIVMPLRPCVWADGRVGFLDYSVKRGVLPLPDDFTYMDNVKES